VNAITAARARTGELVKSALDSARNLPDRILHRRRHLDARRRLASFKRPRKILVVCHGNICRSPYLQAVLQRELPDISVFSAGLFGSDRPVPQISIAVSAKRGLDLSRYRSRPLTRATFDDADLVIVMDSDQASQVASLFPIRRGRVVIAGDLDPQFDASRAIVDPFNQSAEVFESSFDRLDRCAFTLVSIVRRTK
jgi:protein-tyrosine phosphatase